MQYFCDAVEKSWCTVIGLFFSLSCIVMILTVKNKQLLQYYKTFSRLLKIPRTQHLVFIGQLIQSLAMIIHYAILSDSFNILYLVQEYSMSLQYSLVFYYFVSQLCEAFKILVGLYKLRVPLILLNAAMLVGFVVYVGIYLIRNKELYNCNNGIWIYLHGCNLLLSIIFIAIGFKVKKLLRLIKVNRNIIIDNEKIKHFWVIIICMLSASVINASESLYFWNMNNRSCYNRYAENNDLDIVIFCFIRFFSHYVFMFGCLYIFRIQRISLVYSVLASESDRSIRVASYYEEDPFEDMKRDLTKINYSNIVTER